MKCVVKREGHEEAFDERKVYGTCYSACLNADCTHKEAEKICNKLCKDIKRWIKSKKIVTSNQLFKETTKTMKKYDKEAAFMYETHRDIS